MKKLFYLFTLVVMMCSCEPIPAAIEEVNDPQMCDFDRIRHFTYKGHKYISFERNMTMNNVTMAVVHDPNCYCYGK